MFLILTIWLQMTFLSSSYSISFTYQHWWLDRIEFSSWPGAVAGKTLTNDVRGLGFSLKDWERKSFLLDSCFSILCIGLNVLWFYVFRKQMKLLFFNSCHLNKPNEAFLSSFLTMKHKGAIVMAVLQLRNAVAATISNGNSCFVLFPFILSHSSKEIE